MEQRGHVLAPLGLRSGTARQLIRKETVVAWLSLIIAGCFEVVWAAAMKQSEGFTRLWPSVTTIVTLALSMLLLAIAMRSLPLGTAYTVWTGIGAVGAFIFGVVVLGESASVLRLVAATLILSGIVLMKISADG